MHDICSEVVPFAATTFSGPCSDNSFSETWYCPSTAPSLPHFLLVCNPVSESFQFAKPIFSVASKTMRSYTSTPISKPPLNSMGDGKIDGVEQVFLMDGKIVPEKEIFKGPSCSWSEGEWRPYAHSRLSTQSISRLSPFSRCHAFPIDRPAIWHRILDASPNRDGEVHEYYRDLR